MTFCRNITGGIQHIEVVENLGSESRSIPLNSRFFQLISYSAFYALHTYFQHMTQLCAVVDDYLTTGEGMYELIIHGISLLEFYPCPWPNDKRTINYFFS